MPHAVKLPNLLIQEAKLAAANANRSIAGQIEHWARLGRAIEQDLGSPDLRALTARAAAANPSSVSLPEQLGEALGVALQPAARAEFAAVLSNRYRYGTDPAFPGYVVRDDPDGGRTPGRFVKRRFEPLATRDADD